MNKNFTLTGTIVISIGFVLISSFVAMAGPFGPNLKGWGTRSELFDLETFLEINLSTDQQTKMMGILSRYRDERESLWSSITENRRNLSAILNAGQLDEENVRRLFQEVSAIRAEMFLLREKRKIELTSVLTHEQLELVEEYKTRRLEKGNYCPGDWL